MSSESFVNGLFVASGYYLGIKTLIRGIRDGIIRRKIVKHRINLAEPLEGSEALGEGIYIVVFSVFWFTVMAILTYVWLRDL